MFRMVKYHAPRTRRAVLAFSLCTALAGCAGAGEAPTHTPLIDATPTHAETTVLNFGEPTRLTTADPATGTQVTWEVTVEKPQRISGTDAANNIRSPQPQRYTAFHCYPVTLTPVSVGTHPSRPTVPLPELTLISVEDSIVPGEDGSPATTTGRANSVPAEPGSGHGEVSRSGDAAVAPRSAAEAYCDIGSGAPTGYTPDLEEGRAYTTVLASWERRVDPGVPANSVQLEAANVRWG